MGVNYFAFVVATSVEKESKPTILNILTTVRIWHPILAAPIPILPNFRYNIPLNEGVNDFALVEDTTVGKKDKPTILTTLRMVKVWNCNIFFLTAHIPISFKFRCPPLNKGVNDLAFVVGT